MRFNHTPLHAVSSGYWSMLAMVCDILKGLMSQTVYPGFENFQAAPGVILIDEIEVHLHPRWEAQVMSRLRAALPKLTFTVTTHDRCACAAWQTVKSRWCNASPLRRLGWTVNSRWHRKHCGPSNGGGAPARTATHFGFFQMLSTDDAYTDRHQRDIKRPSPPAQARHIASCSRLSPRTCPGRSANSEALDALRRKATDEILAALEGL